jgi:pyruvate,water dikinase
LLDITTDSPTGASVALRVLADARAAHPEAPDDELVARHPVLLALVPPAISTERPLPPTPSLLSSRAHDGEPEASYRTDDRQGPDPSTAREALRLRVRWVHELTVRAALALGDELARRGVLESPVDIRHLRLADVRAALDGRPVVIARRPAGGPPLPAAFRLAGDAVVVPVGAPAGSEGHGAGGGRGSGPVHVYPATGTGTASAAASVADGAVLVVPTLDPALAPLLPGLGGLVAETGSVLSHLAILAREYGVPTVVGLDGATERFAEGTWVVVDGTTGEVDRLGDEEWSAA